MIRQNKVFFALLMALSVFCLILFVVFSKPDLHLAINSLHHPLADYFFKYLTHLGDGIVIAGITIAIIIFSNLRNGLMLLSTYVVSGLFVQLLKKQFLAILSGRLVFLAKKACI